jgi:hypothetical protein
MLARVRLALGLPRRGDFFATPFNSSFAFPFNHQKIEKAKSMKSKLHLTLYTWRFALAVALLLTPRSVAP